MIERPDIVNWRGRYFVNIKTLRSEGRKIFYLNESWVDSNLTFKKCWQSEEVKGVCAKEMLERDSLWFTLDHVLVSFKVRD
jgi:hypothetical protein